MERDVVTQLMAILKIKFYKTIKKNVIFVRKTFKLYFNYIIHKEYKVTMKYNYFVKKRSKQKYHNINVNFRKTQRKEGNYWPLSRVLREPSHF